MQATLPESLRPILWSYDFKRMDPIKHRRTIVVQAINYGTLADWRWLNTTYGREAIREILAIIPASEIRPRVRRLAALIFGVDHFNYAPRGTH